MNVFLFGTVGMTGLCPFTGLQSDFQGYNGSQTVSPRQVNDFQVSTRQKFFPFLFRQVVIKDLEANHLSRLAFRLEDGRKDLVKVPADLTVVVRKYLMIHPYRRRAFQAVQKVVRSGPGVTNNGKSLVDWMAKDSEIGSLESMNVKGVGPVA